MIASEGHMYAVHGLRSARRPYIKAAEGAACEGQRQMLWHLASPNRCWCLCHMSQLIEQARLT